MDRNDIIARLEYWNVQEDQAWQKIEQCQEARVELLGQLAMMEIMLGLDED